MFIKTDSQNNIVTYPYSLDQFRAENTNRSLPKFLNNIFLATQNVYPVYPAEKPEYNETTQFLARKDAPYIADGGWKIGWIIKNKPLEQIEKDLEIHNAELIKKIDAERDRRIAAGFVWRGNTFQSDKESYNNITGAGASATAAIVTGTNPNNVYWANKDRAFTWLSMENIFVEMAPADVLDFGQTSMNHKSKYIFAGRILKNLDPIPLDYQDDKWWG